MKKTMTILLVIAMLACGMVACGETEVETKGTADTTETTDTQPIETELTDGLPETDMDGFTLAMHHFDETWLTWAETILDAEEETGDRLNDAVYQRNLRIEDRFNCELDITDEQRIEGNTIQTAVMSGDSTYDVWFAYDLWVFNAGDVLLPWDDMPYIDLDAEWWNPDATEVFNVGGKTYAAAGNYSLSVLSRASSFVFNKEMYANLGYDGNLYDAVDEGTWTLDLMHTLCEMATMDVNGDGTLDDKDQYGVSGAWKETFWRFIEGSDVRFVSKDEDGYPVFDIVSNENVVNKLLHIYDLFAESNSYFNLATDIHGCSTGEVGFQNGSLLFDVGNFFMMEKMRTYDIEFGILPCPKYDEDQENYYAPSFGAEISVLPKSLPEDRKECVGMLLEALAFDSNQNLIPEYKEVILKTKYSRDEESANAVDIIVSSISFDFGINAWQDVVGGPIIQNIYMKQNENIVSTLTKMQNSVDAQIKSLKETLEQ